MATLLAAIILIVYLPATRNGFVWDDWQYLFNIEYNSPEYWERALKAPLLFSKNYYRPVPVASFLAENYFYGGPSAAAMHLANILLHAFNTVLVAILAFRLGVHLRAAPGRARLIAFFAALVYGPHSTNVETVTWISGRFDLLLTAFLRLALLANTLVRHRVARPLLIGAAFLLAAATKEAAVVFPFVLFAGTWPEHRARCGAGANGLRTCTNAANWPSTARSCWPALPTWHCESGFWVTCTSWTPPPTPAAVSC